MYKYVWRAILSRRCQLPVISTRQVITLTTNTDTVPSVNSLLPPVEMQDIRKPPIHFYRRTLPDTCVPFSSDKGRKLFTEALLSGYMECYFGLAAQFRTQDEPAYCGLSTLVMVLNTLEVDPRRVWKGVWRWYHEEMLDCCVPLGIVAKSGINFDQFSCLAACNTLNVDAVRAPEIKSVSAFRDVIKKHTQLTDSIMVASYSRKVIQQTGDGHFSPVAGYHPEKDLVLILDTARFKYPPHWVSLELLYESMKSIDKDTGLPRGYYVLRKSEQWPLILFRMAFNLKDYSSDNESSVSQFVKSWQSWCQSPALDSNNYYESAISHFLSSVEYLRTDDDVLLSTQLDISCQRKTLNNEHTCAVDQMISDIQNLDLFKKVTVILSKDVYQNSAVINRIGLLQSTKCSHDSPNCSLGLISPAHFITMFLLSWPYPKKGSGSGHRMLQCITQEITGTSTLLQNEIHQLRRQFSLVLDYCEHCACKAQLIRENQNISQVV